MNKEQLTDRMSSENGLTVKQSEKALNGLMDTIHSGLSPGGNVSLIRLGVFSAVNRKVRMMWNPKAGEEVEVKVKKIPVFKTRPTLEWAVNNR